MATGMSGWLTRAIEQAHAAEPGCQMQLHTAGRPAPPTLPVMPTFKPLGWVARPGVPGKLATYPSRVEHARAHRLAAERARRNRRCVRKGRPVPGELRPGSVLTWAMTVDLSGFNAAIEGAGRALRQFGEAVSTVGTRWLEFDRCQLASLYGQPADETAGPDTDYCAGTGVRWSDLMAQIDELIEEPTVPGYCSVHQHYMWCDHNGGVLRASGYGPPELIEET